MPFIGLSVESDQSVRLCCHISQRDMIKDSTGKPLRFTQVKNVSEIINSNYLKQVRLEMLSNKIPAACKNCHKSESLSGHSPRMEYLREFHSDLELIAPSIQPDGSIEVKIKHFHYSTDNICNLACRMCHPRYSVKIAQEWEKLGLVRPDDPEFFINTEKLSHLVEDNGLLENLLDHLSEMKITGGEPFLSPYVEFLVKKMAIHPRASEIELSFYTNATTYPEHLLNELKRFKKISFYCSIDAVGKLAEYVRYGCDWNKVQANLMKFQKLTNQSQFKMRLVTTLSAYAFLGLPELLKFTTAQLNAEMIIPEFNPLYAPSALTLEVLHRELIEKTRDEIQTFFKVNNFPLNEENLKHLRNLYALIDETLKLKTGERYLDFILFSQKLDHKRGQSLKNVLPVLFTKENSP